MPLDHASILMRLPTLMLGVSLAGLGARPARADEVKAIYWNVSAIVKGPTDRATADLEQVPEVSREAPWAAPREAVQALLKTRGVALLLDDGPRRPAPVLEGKIAVVGCEARPVVGDDCVSGFISVRWTHRGAIQRFVQEEMGGEFLEIEAKLQLSLLRFVRSGLDAPAPRRMFKVRLRGIGFADLKATRVALRQLPETSDIYFERGTPDALRFSVRSSQEAPALAEAIRLLVVNGKHLEVEEIAAGGVALFTRELPPPETPPPPASP